MQIVYNPVHHGTFYNLNSGTIYCIICKMKQVHNVPCSTLLFFFYQMRNNTRMHRHVYGRILNAANSLKIKHFTIILKWNIVLQFQMILSSQQSYLPYFYHWKKPLTACIWYEKKSDRPSALGKMTLKALWSFSYYL